MRLQLRLRKITLGAAISTQLDDFPTIAFGGSAGSCGDEMYSCPALLRDPEPCFST
jgi:hypothetical protein